MAALTATYAVVASNMKAEDREDFDGWVDCDLPAYEAWATVPPPDHWAEVADVAEVVT